MQDCKPISTPLPVNFKLSSRMSPSNEDERMEMSRVPYASAVGVQCSLWFVQDQTLHKQWEWLVGTWRIQAKRALECWEKDSREDPYMLHYVTKDQKFLPDDMLIQTMHDIWIRLFGVDPFVAW